MYKELTCDQETNPFTMTCMSKQGYTHKEIIKERENNSVSTEYETNQSRQECFNNELKCEIRTNPYTAAYEARQGHCSPINTTGDREDSQTTQVPSVFEEDYIIRDSSSLPHSFAPNSVTFLGMFIISSDSSSSKRFLLFNQHSMAPSFLLNHEPPIFDDVHTDPTDCPSLDNVRDDLESGEGCDDHNFFAALNSPYDKEGTVLYDATYESTNKEITGSKSIKHETTNRKNTNHYNTNPYLQVKDTNSYNCLLQKDNSFLHFKSENDASDEASDVPSKDSTTVDSEEINQHVAEDTEVQDSTVSSSEESLSSTPSGDDTEVKERDIEADVRDTYISATETEHTDDHQTVLSSEHKLPAEQSDVSDTPLDEIQKTEPEEFEVTMEASSELEASKTGDSIEPSMISVDEIKVSVTDDLTVIPGDGVPDDSSTQIVKDIDIAPLTDTASGHSDESDNIINVEATEPLDENEGDDDVRTTIVDGTVIDLDEYEYSAVITPSQTFSDLDLPDLPTPAISDTKPSPSPATIEDKVDTVQPTSVLDGIDLLSITDISGHAGDAYSPSPGDFMSRKTLEVTEPGIDGSQPEEPHTDYETVTDSPIEHKASPLIEEDVTVTPKPVTHASLIEPPTIPQLGTEEEVDAFCADKLTATNGMLLTYVQAVNNVDRVMDKILFVVS